MTRKHRRTLKPLALLLLLPALAACGGASNSGGVASAATQKSPWSALTFTIGQQANGILTLAKESGVFAHTPYTVKWDLFSYGPPLVEAASAGDIDLGDVGDVPPITGAAKETGFKVVAAELPEKSTEAGDYLLVPKGSSIRTLADLRGKSISVPIGSSAHGFLLNALESVGLKPSDVKLVNLAPGPGAAAFDSGKVDAWAIWQPQATIEQQKGARLLLAGHPPLDYDTDYYVASTRDLNDPVRRAALTDVLRRLAQAYQWGDSHVSAWEQAVQAETQVPASVADAMVPDSLLKVRYVTPTLVAAEQKLANDFLATGQVDKPVKARAVVENLLPTNFTTN